ncbi:MAG TPA: GlcNAc-PI de-N-acetylase, partial [Isosphaeraceae bacterium]|nr:GlcNAc-PI de-N-acetylase [Isosphaeraceae bacterium]
LTDYTKYCSLLGRAYAALSREWSEGHSLADRAPRGEERYVGVELFQIEKHDPARCEASPRDPIQIALGLLGGRLAPNPAQAAV